MTTVNVTPIEERMKICPCCSSRLLHQVRRTGIYWFCPHCWQEMPILEGAMRANPTRHSAHT